MMLLTGCIFMGCPSLAASLLLMAAGMAPAGMQPATRFLRAWDTPNLTPSCSAASKGASTCDAWGSCARQASWSKLYNLHSKDNETLTGPSSNQDWIMQATAWCKLISI